MAGDYSSDVHIYNHNRVEVIGTVRMATGKKIVVHPGGILRIKDATITHISDNFSNQTTGLWDGIIVLGNPNLSQDIEKNFNCYDEICFRQARNAFLNYGTGVNVNDDPENPTVDWLCPIINNIQGIVACEGAKIRYANVGIAVGDENNPHGSNSYWPNGTKGGAFIRVVNSTFVNNLRSAISFAEYKNFPQQSVIQNNNFVYDFKTITSLSKYDAENFLMSNFNTFKNPISGNTFVNNNPIKYTPSSNLTITNSVLFLHSYATFENNTFNGKDQHSTLYTQDYYTNVLSPTLIRNNNFNNIYTCSVRLIAKDNVKVYVNNFYQNTPGFSDGVIGINYSNNFVAESNSINNFSSIQTNPTFFGPGISIRNTDIKTAFIKYNYIQDFPFASQSIGINTNTMIQCNTFIDNYKGDLNISNGGSYSSGLPSAVLGAQGHPLIPAGNSFSSYTGSGFYNIKNSGAIFKYYYKNPKNPSYILNVNRKQVTFGADICSAPFYAFPLTNECGTYDWFWFDWNTEGGLLWSDYQTHANDKENIELSGINTTNEDAYHYALLKYEYGLSELINHYSTAYLSSDTIPNIQYKDSMYALLSNHQTFTGKYYLVQLMVADSNYTNAQSLINDLITNNPTDSNILEFCEYMELILDYSENNHNVSWLSSNFDAVKNIADNDNHYMSPQAKVLCNLASATDSTNTYFGEWLYDFNQIGGGISDTLAEEEDMDLDITIFPNPFSSDISVQVTDTRGMMTRNLTVEIVNFSNTFLDSDLLNISPLATQTTIIGETAAANSYYIIRIKEGGVQLYDDIVYKN